MSNYENKVLSTVAPTFDGEKVKNKPLLEKLIRENVYNDIITRIGCSMFKWTLPEEVARDLTSDMIELAINTGVAVLYKVPKKASVANGGRWACTPLEYVGPLRNDGTSDNWITRGSDYALNVEQIEDGYAIIKNNAFMSNEYRNVNWFADMLNNTDIAERALIKWCRVTPIAKATSGIDAAKLEDVLKNVWEGVNPFGIISDDTKLITGQPMSRDDAVLKLTDENIIEKMHFLSEFHYELIRRICTLYNIPFRTTSKSAQNLESELHNTDIFSQMTTVGRREFRELGAEDARAAFNWTEDEFNVTLGEKFQAEDAAIENALENDAPENVSRETPAEDNNAEENETADDDPEGGGDA